MAIVDIFLYIWNLFTLWIDTLFIIPFKNTDMLWILVPLWLSWFFGEFFQEKIGTSFGNAISNAVIVLWAGVDCIRQTVGFINDGALSGTGDILVRFFLCGILIGYGIIIIIFGTKVKEKVKIFGRIRDVTYAFAILVPVLYDVVPLTTELVIAAVIFFPLFYYIIEFIDVKTPTPKAMQADFEESEHTMVVGGKIINTPNSNPQIQDSINNRPAYPPPSTSNPINNSINNKPPSTGSVSYWNNDNN